MFLAEPCSARYACIYCQLCCKAECQKRRPKQTAQTGFQPSLACTLHLYLRTTHCAHRSFATLAREPVPSAKFTAADTAVASNSKMSYLITVWCGATFLHTIKWLHNLAEVRLNFFLAQPCGQSCNELERPYTMHLAMKSPASKTHSI